MSGRIAAALLLLLAGCLEFREITLPPPLDPVPAEFRADIEFRVPPPGEGIGSGRPDSVRIHAVLRPGLDAAGAAQPIRDDTLRVGGVAVPPTRVDPAGTRMYEGWVRLPPATEQGLLLAIVPPALGPDGRRPPALYQPIPVRTGSGVRDLVRGEDLRLALSVAAPSAGTDPGFQQQWSLEVAGERARMGMSGWGPPPAPLVIPAALIPTIATERMQAQLAVHSRTGLGRRLSEGYFIEVSMNAWLDWSIRLVDGP